MKYRWEKKYLYWGFTAFLVIILSISFLLLFFHIKEAYEFVRKIVSILMPFIVGLTIAYLLNPIVNMIENKWFRPLLNLLKRPYPNKLPRIIAIIITIILALTFITGLLFLVIPQLTESVKSIIDNMELYFKNFEEWIIGLASHNENIETLLADQFKDINTTINDWAKNSVLPQLDNIITGVTSGVIGVFIFLKNFFLGLIISIYVLYSKEKFRAQAKKMTYFLFSVKASNRIIKITRRADRVFGGFITGKLIDSLIMGMLCFAGMSILKLPFPLLISVIIGITNIIPFFGPFFGAVPSALLILMIDPLACLYFLIFVLLLQQFDGNILGPMILGDSTGLSAFWVIFAILISGGLFGFMGMIVGVPLFAVLYSLIVEVVDDRLKRHELPIETSRYNDLVKIDTMTHEIITENETPKKNIRPFYMKGFKKKK